MSVIVCGRSIQTVRSCFKQTACSHISGMWAILLWLHTTFIYKKLIRSCDPRDAHPAFIR